MAIALVWLAGNACALDPGRAVWQYVHDRWGPEKGFLGGPISAITQSSDGYLWIGAEAGLIRFDGLTFTVVRDRGPNAFVMDHVLGLSADRDGSLSVQLSEPTLLRYREGTFSAVRPNPKREDSRVTAIASANGGGLLLASRMDGAALFVGSHFKTLAGVASLPASPVISIAQRANNEVWLGTREEGLIRLGKSQVSTITKGLPDLKINCLLPEKSGDVLIGTDHGMVRWNGSEVTKAGVPRALDHAQILAMTRDRDSNIWIGTGTQGLLRLNDEGLASLGESGRRAAITALFEDREGDVWAGSANGVERLRDSPFVAYSVEQGLPKENGGPIYADAWGRIWWAPVTGGLYWLKEGKVGHVAEAGLERDVVYSISGDHDDLWLGRQRGGLTHLHLEGRSVKAKTYTQTDGLAENTIYTVHQNRDGSVWAGTLTGGVSHFQDGRFETFTSANGLVADTVTSIAESADGTMWFATPSGLSSCGRNGWRTYGVGDGLPSENVYSLLFDSSGDLWVGTLHGIAFVHAGRIVVPAGLPPSLHEKVFGISEDRAGSLWVVTSSSVLRVARDKICQGLLVDGDVREYRLTDGLTGMQGVRRDRSVVADPSGRVWLSRSVGLSMVDPTRLSVESVQSIAQIDGFSVDGGSIDPRHPVSVPWNRRRVAIAYAGLNLSAPDRVRFRFRLDGFDRTWSGPVSGKEAVYTNLGPGSYRFHVMASNADGVWNGGEATMPFEVDPALWQTWWFRLCTVLSLAVTMAALYRWRLHQLTVQVNLRFDERLAERTRLARELHDTLLQTIQGSKMVADDALEIEGGALNPTRMHTALEKVSVWLEQATQEGRAALHSLRNSTSQENDLAEAFRRAANDCLSSHPMEVSLFVEGAAIEMHPIVRDEIFRIGFEAIRNACRHSGASRLEVELSYAKRFTLRVRDNGKGIDPDVAAKGKEGHFGLQGMQERAKRVGGKLSLFSSSGSGSEVELIVPGRLAFRGRRRRAVDNLRRLFRNKKSFSPLR